MSSHMMEKDDDATNNMQSYVKVDINSTDKDAKVPDQPHVFPISQATILFQALMILASVYYSMLMTNWGDPSVMDGTYGFFSENYTSYWIQMVALWTSQALYTFSLTGPICFPNREFS